MGSKRQIVIDSKEVAVEEFPWGEIRWLWSSNINPDAEQTFGVVRINPGEKNMAHIHSNCEELLYVVSGECNHGIGDKVYHLEEGMLICIPEGVDHYAVNTGDGPFEAIISYSSPERQMKSVEG
jgi:mannose-6-phosphate isomerase-like protein (cupin superfamily)